MLELSTIDKLYPYDKAVVLSPTRLDNVVDAAAKLYGQSLWKQLITKEIDEEIRLRPSVMGKSAIDILARQFFPELYQCESLPVRFPQLFHDGDTFESDLYTWLSITGVPILHVQQDICWRGIAGHSDMVVELDGKPVLLELKTANDNYFNSVLKKQTAEGREFRYGDKGRGRTYLAHTMDDFRGHITQASIYGAGLGIRDIVIMLKCKSSSELLIYNLSQTDIDNSLKRAATIAEVWDTVNTWPEVYTKVGIPLPKAQIQAKNKTGLYYISPKMYGSPIIPLIYELAYDEKIYVVGYRVHEDAVDNLPEHLVDTYSELGLTTYSNMETYDLLEEYARYKA